MIHVHNDASGDLRAIRSTDSVGFGRLIALIEQLRIDPLLRDRLLEHNFGANKTAQVSVSKWIAIFNKVPLWRLKAWDLERHGLRYRIIYLYYWRDKTFHIMAVVPRDQLDYDDSTHPLRQRVIARVKSEFPDI